MRSVVLLALSVGACSGRKDTMELPDAAYDCATETRAEQFSAGMSKVGTQGVVTFKLMSSTPAPPARGNNEWTLQLVDGAGTPISGATVTVTPFMPDHNHGASLKAIITEPSPGTYDIKQVNLWMPGFWQTTVTATPTGGTLDKALFNFCIAG